MKPSIPKGTRDFGPEQVRKRNFIFATIEAVFSKYGFARIETPAMESLDTLTGKYGAEGDQLLFKVLNNGDFLSKVEPSLLEAKDSLKVLPNISKRGLRYDLTVPFARFVVMHQNEIQFPFKRFQIQPVWRADRPQKGRYQEFYQCDADVVGSHSLVYEAELIQIYDEVFHLLNIPVTIKINHRQILFGIAEKLGIVDQFQAITVAIDKMDKIGLSGVKEQMQIAGLDTNHIEWIGELLSHPNLENVEHLLGDSSAAQEGLLAIKTVFKYLKRTPLHQRLIFDLTLARGLSYYTGCIFEVAIDTQVMTTIQMGSLGGGGRYDNLTGIFGLSGVSGVGISFGAERIYDVLEAIDGFPPSTASSLQLLICPLDQEGIGEAFYIAHTLRENGIHCDLYPDAAKLKKQLKFASDRGIPYCLILGSEELATQIYTLKNMDDGSQTTLKLSALIEQFS
jgi:histidyl-tRNA synthetase